MALPDALEPGLSGLRVHERGSESHRDDEKLDLVNHRKPPWSGSAYRNLVRPVSARIAIPK